MAQLRRVLIEPELDALQAHNDARSAVVSLCDWMAEQSEDSGSVLSDDEIRALLMQRSRVGFVARFLGVDD